MKNTQSWPPPQYGTQTSDEYFEISFWKIRTSLKIFFLRFFQNGLFWVEPLQILKHRFIFFMKNTQSWPPPQYGTQTSYEYFETSFWKIRMNLKKYFLRFFQNGLFWCELSNFPNLGSRIEIILCESYWAVTVSDRYT